MNVAETILSQLGGNRFVVMTGAKNLLKDHNALSMRLPSRKVTHVRITLDPSDTYTVLFLRMRGYQVTEVARVSDVYADSLREVFTRYTGLETSLGTMSAGR